MRPGVRKLSFVMDNRNVSNFQKILQLPSWANLLNLWVTGSQTLQYPAPGPPAGRPGSAPWVAPVLTPPPPHLPCGRRSCLHCPRDTPTGGGGLWYWLHCDQDLPLGCPLRDLLMPLGGADPGSPTPGIHPVSSLAPGSTAPGNCSLYGSPLTPPPPVTQDKALAQSNVTRRPPRREIPHHPEQLL